MVGGGAGVGAARPRTASVSLRSEHPLVGALCCGDGSVEFPPRGRHGDGDDRVMWGTCPSARLSTLRRFLRRRGGAGKVCEEGSRSPSLLQVSEGEDDLFVAVLHASSSPSCGYAATESDDFPCAWMLPEVPRFSPAPGGCGGGSAAARLRSASVDAVVWVSEDLVVISGFFRVFCTAVNG